MIGRVKARFSGGVLTPLEPLDIEEGTEVTVSVEETPTTPAEGQVVKETPEKGPLTDVLALVREMEEKMPPEERAKSRLDGARNYKHYLYGHPKERE